MLICRFEQYQLKQITPKPVIVEDAISEDSRNSEILIPKEPTRTKKVDDTSIYEQYSLCRSFPRGNHIKHVNRQLIAMRSKNGVFVLRPHHTFQTGDTLSPAFMSRIFSMILLRGNKGDVTTKVSASLDESCPYLKRNVPSEKDLSSKRILTAPVTVRRGPGRPFGSYCPKSVSKRSRPAASQNKSLSKHSRTVKRSKHSRRSEDSSDSPDLPPLQPPTVVDDPNLAEMMNVFDISSIFQGSSK